MTLTRFLILAVFTMAMGLLAGMFGYAGYQWLTTGYGLYPAIAFPFAVLCAVVVGLFWAWMLADDEPYEIDDYVIKHFPR